MGSSADYVNIIPWRPLQYVNLERFHLSDTV